MTERVRSRFAVGVACLTKPARFGVLAVLLMAMSLTASLAQMAAPLVSAAAALDVPTTKILAIGSFTAKAPPNAWQPILASEMRETAGLYLAGRINQWYVKQDHSGVVFIMNVTDPKGSS